MSSGNSRLKPKQKGRLRHLRQQAQQEFPARIIPTPPGQAKMSEVFLEFVEPYTDLANNSDAMNKLLTLALVAWNAALYTGDKRRRFIEEMSMTLPPELRPEFARHIEGMIRRKEQLFASHRRMILSFEAGTTPTGGTLRVMSTLHDI